VLFIVGVAGIIWQTVAEDVDRPYLLAIFAGCVGLPIYLASMPKAHDPFVKSVADEEEKP
jgi:TctA family transporter